eukprot:TRINITY_DN19959_c0_g1_i2.p1 TRINITY_DN19959_c0_g1~~TRINITY_DN19959_c0_g1_i2.p1  ORF type:complete len:223 (-),score=33.54 TRINITY_DN19959_c0_g1_i2:33-659(-)
MSKTESSASSWNQQWNPSVDFYKGEELGFVGVGKIVQLRFHTLTTKSDIVRFNAVVIDVTNVHKRSYNKYGAEVDPNWKTNPEGPSKITADALAEQLSGSKTAAAPAKLMDNTYLAKLHPNVKQRFEFWIDIDAGKKANLEVGAEVQFKTNRSSIFLTEIRRTGNNFANYKEGGEMLNQISKISDTHETSKVLPQDQMEGVADEEWDD